MKADSKYDDIMYMPHHVSLTRPQMSIEARAAQFAPFAALTGYDDVIEETIRLTSDKKDMDDALKNVLDEKMKNICSMLKERPVVTFTYFVPDERKDGGEYTKLTGIVKKVDDYNKIIVMENGSIIPIDQIFDIEY